MMALGTHYIASGNPSRWYEGEGVSTLDGQDARQEEVAKGRVLHLGNE